MARGVSIKFSSYEQTVPKLLALIKLDKELVKHKKIVLKVHLDVDSSKSTPWQFADIVLRYCLAKKDPESEIYIAEGADEGDTQELFEANGYNKLAERYSVGLVDLNTAEVEEIIDGSFLKFESIKYPKILSDSFIISLPKLKEDSELEMLGSLSIMKGAYPKRFYSGFFSNKKSKIRKWPLKYAIYDIVVCKKPEFTIIDASEQGFILAGVPLEMDKQAAKLIGKDWRAVPYLKLFDENYKEKIEKEKKAISADDGEIQPDNPEEQ